MFIAGLLFIVIFFGTLLGRKKQAGSLDIPVSEAYHDEKRIELFDRFKPWLIAMVVIILFAYVPPLINANTNPGPNAPPFNTNNPVPVTITTSK